MFDFTVHVRRCKLTIFFKASFEIYLKFLILKIFIEKKSKQVNFYYNSHYLSIVLFNISRRWKTAIFQWFKIFWPKKEIYKFKKFSQIFKETTQKLCGHIILIQIFNIKPKVLFFHFIKSFKMNMSQQKQTLIERQ